MFDFRSHVGSLFGAKMRVKSVKFRCQLFDYFLSTLLVDFDPHFETFLVTFEQISEEKGETSEHVIFTYPLHENLFF